MHENERRESFPQILESQSLAYQKVYPDSTGSTDRVTFQYNRQRQEITMTDQAGTVHGYGFDMFGRGIEDAVSAFGTGVDQTVKKITLERFSTVVEIFCD